MAYIPGPDEPQPYPWIPEPDPDNPPPPPPPKDDEEEPVPEQPQPQPQPQPDPFSSWVPDYVRMYNATVGLQTPQTTGRSWWEHNVPGYGAQPTQVPVPSGPGPYGGMNALDWRAQMLTAPGQQPTEGIMDARTLINNYYASLFGVQPQQEDTGGGGWYGGGGGGGGGGTYPKQPINPWFAGLQNLNANR